MILFFNEDVDFQLLRKNSWKKWIKSVVISHGREIGELNYIFCSDEYLLEVNQKYLNHDYYTDIITFPMESDEKKVAGDLFISIDRVMEHSQMNQCSFMDELKRVMIHGVLHLIGFNDHTQKEKDLMRELEGISMAMFHVEQSLDYYKNAVSRETN